MNHNFKDITGMRFGQLYVVKYSHTDKNGRARWLCKCDCGNETYVIADKLLSGRTASCGHTRYGKKEGPHPARDNPELYVVWLQMKGRCYCKTRDNYKYYGGKGVKVCEEWMSFPVFCEWALANGYNPKANHGECTLDRIDPQKDYCPENCRFVSWDVQANNRTDNHKVSYHGETKTIAQWARQIGMDPSTLGYRIRAGWSAEKAFNTPIKGRCLPSQSTGQKTN